MAGSHAGAATHCCRASSQAALRPALAAAGLVGARARAQALRGLLARGTGAGRAHQRWPGPPAPPRDVLDAHPAREEQRRLQHPGGGAGPHRCSRERCEQWRLGLRDEEGKGVEVI